MISGRSERVGARLVLLAILLVPQAVLALTWQTVVAEIAEQATTPVRFEETQYRFYLDEPLVSRGRMRFEPPATLIREIADPEPMVLTIEANRLIRQTPDGRRREVALSEHPLIGNLAHLLLDLFNGNVADLADRFRVGFASGPGGWSMRLTPRRDRVRQWIKVIRLQGNGGFVTRIVIVERNDDRTELRLRAEGDGSP